MRTSQIFNNPHYVKKHTKDHLHSRVDNNFRGERDLVISLMHMAIDQTTVKTYHELDIINENLWSYNDFPETEGFGSSDRSEYLRRIKESIAFERKFLQAENELVQINKLTESPKNDTVRKYMAMNDKIAEGMVA